jgi:hypothetical protein
VAAAELPGATGLGLDVRDESWMAEANGGATVTGMLPAGPVPEGMTIHPSQLATAAKPSLNVTSDDRPGSRNVQHSTLTAKRRL